MPAMTDDELGFHLESFSPEEMAVAKEARKRGASKGVAVRQVLARREGGDPNAVEPDFGTRLAAAGTMAAHGASFGLSPGFRAGAGYLRKIGQGGTNDEAMTAGREALDEQENNLDAARAVNPRAAPLMEIAGGALPMLALPGAAAPTLARAVGESAVIGGLASEANAKNPDDLVSSGLEGAAVGAALPVVGAALPVVGAAVPKVAGGVLRSARGGFRNARESAANVSDKVIAAYQNNRELRGALAGATFGKSEVPNIAAHLIRKLRPKPLPVPEAPASALGAAEANLPTEVLTAPGRRIPPTPEAPSADALARAQAAAQTAPPPPGVAPVFKNKAATDAAGQSFQVPADGPIPYSPEWWIRSRGKGSATSPGRASARVKEREAADALVAAKRAQFAEQFNRPRAPGEAPDRSLAPPLEDAAEMVSSPPLSPRDPLERATASASEAPPTAPAPTQRPADVVSPNARTKINFDANPPENESWWAQSERLGNVGEYRGAMDRDITGGRQALPRPSERPPVQYEPPARTPIDPAEIPKDPHDRVMALRDLREKKYVPPGMTDEWWDAQQGFGKRAMQRRADKARASEAPAQPKEPLAGDPPPDTFTAVDAPFEAAITSGDRVTAFKAMIDRSYARADEWDRLGYPGAADAMRQQADVASARLAPQGLIPIKKRK